MPCYVSLDQFLDQKIAGVCKMKDKDGTSSSSDSDSEKETKKTKKKLAAISIDGQRLVVAYSICRMTINKTHA